MDFYEMFQKLQMVYEHSIIMLSCGGFYIAIGADAASLNKELGLKLICAKRNLCKVGIPKTAIDKYVEKLDEIGYSYIILDYNKEDNKITKIKEKQGKNKDIYQLHNNCYMCKKRKRRNYQI